MLPDSSVKTIQKFKLQNSQGTQVEILNLGAILHSWKVRNNKSEMRDIVLAPTDLNDYFKPFEARPYYFGATIGRYAGRIRKGFRLDGVEFPLDSNEDQVHLHGGPQAIDRKYWELDVEASDLPYSLVLFCTCEDGEGGYPGTVTVEARYTLNDDDSLEIEYRAQSDANTYLNLTNHVYFNLDGDSVLEHDLHLRASRSLETTAHLLPTGRFLPVEGGPLDYCQRKALDKLATHDGLDHCFVLDQQDEQQQAIAYRSEKVGWELQGWTNQAAVVVFAPEKLDVDISLNGASTNFPSICFEFQNLPDAPNFRQFPSSLLKKGEIYRNWSRFQLKQI
jgi:aldose 1-epimerase